MKVSKDRLHRVIIIGATPAGVAAANKLGELGIPVALVDVEPDLDQKLAREQWKLTSGLSFNFAHRSGLLRILRNPLIHCVLPARIASLKHTPQGFRARIVVSGTFVNPERCILCGRCAAVCPVTTPDGSRPIAFAGRRSLPGRPVIEKRRRPPCQESCPLGVNAQGYLALAGAGKYREALELVRRDNILPGICGRVCTHPCEAACRRTELDESIAIRDIKRFLADYDRAHPGEGEKVQGPQRPERVAVVGSGPAGLAAAADLARFGYRVTVFEKEAMAGGLLRYGIGPHRLPREILDEELDHIRSLGVDIRTGCPVDLSREPEVLKNKFQAVVLCVGAWRDRKLGAPGEDLEGVEGCVAFLSRVYRGEVKRCDGKVAVIGDGNAAFDLARVLRRLGAEVTILSWFADESIPADPQEVRAAREEGIAVRDRTRVVAFAGKDGKVNRLRCRPTQPGKPDAAGIAWPVVVPGSEAFELAFDRAVVAIGQTGVLQEQGTSWCVEARENGCIRVDDSFRTSASGIYAAGDAVTGASCVVEAMARGRGAARAVHEDLSGQETEAGAPWRPADRDFPEIPEQVPSEARPPMAERQPGARGGDFLEVALGLTEAQVHSEAHRCLQCGVCSECLLCSEACGPVGAVCHDQQDEEIIEHAGVVIIADPEAAPPIKGEDVIRAYGPKSATWDTASMITRGFAAASQAMVLLGGSTQRPKGHGLSFSPPDPQLSPDVRVGVFACRCNDSMGWHQEMTSHVEGLIGQPGIIHAEVLPAACVPEGAAGILRAIREKGITRVVLASCVCCSLDLVCSACTDQRSRLKQALFSGTGVTRSMVETCNLRGEALAFLAHDPEHALGRFKGLLKRSIHRAERLMHLPAPARNYNFSTAVIGQSEAAVNSALSLAEAGLDVFMFGTPGKPLTISLDHPNIQCFEGFVVREIGGTLGAFKLFAESKDHSQTLQVGAVILGEKSRRRVPYLHHEGLPSKVVDFSIQKRGVSGVPFCYPGATPIAGLFLASPPGVYVSERKKGSAAAALAAAVMPRGPRHNKGYTVVVDQERCRGCGRCMDVCSYKAVSFEKNSVGGWYAVVDEALCKGCGNCISVCPSNAADSPYRNQGYLEQLIEEVLVQRP